LKERDKIANMGRRMARIIAGNRYGKEAIENRHIHHIDGNPLNNSLSNLQILDAKEHRLKHRGPRPTRWLFGAGKHLDCDSCGSICSADWVSTRTTETGIEEIVYLCDLCQFEYCGQSKNDGQGDQES